MQLSIIYVLPSGCTGVQENLKLKLLVVEPLKDDINNDKMFNNEESEKKVSLRLYL